MQSPVDDDTSFLKAIIDHPSDETVRLAYSDWLAERDDPRSRFARLSADFLRLTRDLAESRSQFDSDWIKTIDPLFNRVEVEKLPALGEGILTSIVTHVFITSGQRIVAGQPSIAVETDKAALDVPTEGDGLVLSVYARVGAELPVGSPIDAFLNLPQLGRTLPPSPAPVSLPVIDRQPILRLIQRLESQINSSGTWTSAGALRYLDHYSATAEMLFGQDETRRAYQEAQSSIRGWLLARKLTEQMRERNLTDDQMAREHFAIHVAAFQSLLDRYGQPVGIRDLPQENPATDTQET